MKPQEDTSQQPDEKTKGVTAVELPEITSESKFPELGTEIIALDTLIASASNFGELGGGGYDR